MRLAATSRAKYFKKDVTICAVVKAIPLLSYSKVLFTVIAIDTNFKVIGKTHYLGIHENFAEY